MKKLTAELLERCFANFRRADLTWRREGHGDVPLLLLPAELLRWGETLIYFANSGVGEHEGERWLFLEVCAFDAAARDRGDVRELDWCIPMDHAAATQRDRDKWTLGLGEGWSDSYEVTVLVFGEEWRELFAGVVKLGRLALGEVGQKTASLVQQLDRNLKDLTLFAG